MQSCRQNDTQTHRRCRADTGEDTELNEDGTTALLSHTYTFRAYSQDTELWAFELFPGVARCSWSLWTMHRHNMGLASALNSRHRTCICCHKSVSIYHASRQTMQIHTARFIVQP